MLNFSSKRWVLFTIFIVLLSFFLFWFKSKEIEVEVTPVVLTYPYQSLTILNASGYVVAQRKASLSSKQTGILEWLGVQEGSVVGKGELIAKLERDDIAARLSQEVARIGLAKAELENAKLAHGRSISLLNKGYISKSTFDDTLSRLNKAKASLRAAEASKNVIQANYSQAEIRAPFDGVVLTKNANVGDNITPFSSAANSKGAVVTIADMSTLEVVVDVSESNMSKISVGQPVVILLDALPDERFYGKVVRMIPTIDRSKATRMIKVGFDKLDSRILPDMSSKVAFLERDLLVNETLSYTAISREAVLLDSDSKYFFKVEDKILRQIEIRPETSINSDLVPVEKIEVGSLVVINPNKKLFDGGKVKVIEP